MKALTTKAKIEKLVEMLIEASEECCRNEGGQLWPDDVRMIGNHLVVATLDGDGAPQLKSYTARQAVEWYDFAMEYQRKFPELSIAECLWETEEDVAA